MKKLLLCILILFSLLLSGCSPSAKSAESILADIRESDHYYNDYNLSLDKYSIIKRQTNIEDKSDYIWFSVKSSNSDFLYEASYFLRYTLYNDGWKLDICTINDSSYTAQNSSIITENTLHSSLQENGFSVNQIISRNEYLNQVIYHCLISSESFYEIDHYEADIIFSFTPWNGWNKCEIDKDYLYTTHDLLGEWVYKDDSRYFYLNIIDIDQFNHYNISEERYITLEYCLLNIENVHTNRIVNYQSEGIVKKSFTYSLGFPNHHSADIDVSYLHAYIGSVGNEIDDFFSFNHSGAGLYINEFFLTRMTEQPGHQYYPATSSFSTPTPSPLPTAIQSYNYVSTPIPSFYTVGRYCDVWLQKGGSGRSGPGTEYSEVTKIKNGDVLLILDSQMGSTGKDWFKVNRNGEVFWVSSGLVTLDGHSDGFVNGVPIAPAK
ncbi:MAG: SH3 domain-containing protein [Clostridia bacterium]|nr:SH3 domain-containing protein [Clostridia bacterium]